MSPVSARAPAPGKIRPGSETLDLNYLYGEVALEGGIDGDPGDQQDDGEYGGHHRDYH